ncbi:MAG: helix-turn-helix transcriptional regulator [Lachnospiraceae bacterium]|nr:helix-turn-helix transcriptional regulator [Lachnospiraceae bacterium]
MNKARKAGKRILILYAFRYGMVVILTAFLVLLLANWILEQYRQELVSNAREKMRESAVVLDTEITGQNEMAKEIYLNQLTRPSHMLMDDIRAKEGVSQLKVFQGSLLVNDYVFVRYQNEVIYSQQGSLSLDTFIERTLQLEEKSAEKLKNALDDHTQNTMTVLTTLQGESMLLYLYPVLNIKTDTKDMAGFIILGETLEDYLLSQLPDVPAYMMLTGESGEVLCEINMLEDISNKQLKELREKLLLGETFTESALTIDVYESANGFRLCTAVENDYILADFNKIILRTFSYGILIFGIAFVMIWMINRANVQQIQKIRDNLLAYNDLGENTEENELQLIQRLIDQMHREHENKEVKRQQFYRNMSSQIAGLLFGGLIEQEEALCEIVTCFCPELKSPCYVVMSVIVQEDKEGLLEHLTGQFPFSVYSIEAGDNCTILSFAIGLQSHDEDGEERMQMAQQLIRKAGVNEIEDIYIVTGRVYEKLREIHRSYNEMMALGHTLLSDNYEYGRKISLFEQVIKECLDICIGKEQIMNLKKAIRSGTVQDAERSLHNIIMDLQELTNQIERAFGYYTLVQLLYELLQEKSCDSKRLDILLHIPFDDQDVFMANVLKIIRSMKEESQISIDSIMDYINVNYKDGTLGLDALAAHFNMSVSYVSRYIKKHSGMNYMEYVTRIRIDEACRLLKETDMSIQDITYEVGYSDNVSFSRKFKALKGVTPGEYRKKENDDA